MHGIFKCISRMSWPRQATQCLPAGRCKMVKLNKAVESPRYYVDLNRSGMRCGSTGMPSLLTCLTCSVLGPQSKPLYYQCCGRIDQYMVWFLKHWSIWECRPTSVFQQIFSSLSSGSSTSSTLQCMWCVHLHQKLDCVQHTMVPVMW